MLMKKTSTLVYSIHNLASKANLDIKNTKDFNHRNEFAEVFRNLEASEPYNVRQEVVDRILKIANSN